MYGFHKGKQLSFPMALYMILIMLQSAMFSIPDPLKLRCGNSNTGLAISSEATLTDYGRLNDEHLATHLFIAIPSQTLPRYHRCRNLDPP